MIRKLGKDAAIYGGGDFLFKIIGFAVFPIYTHLFTVAEFGTIALLAASSSLVGVFINIGVNNAVQRFYWDPATPEEDRPLLVTTGFVQLVITGVAVTTLLWFGLAWQQQFIADKYAIPWSALSLALLAILPDQMLQYLLDAIRLRFSPLRFLLISFCKNILGIALGLVFVLHYEGGLTGMFLGALLASLLTVPLGLWMVREDLVWRFSARILKTLLHFGYPFVFAGIAYWVSNAMDRWMLAQLGNSVEVGLYGVAFKFAVIVTFVVSAFGQAWSPYAIRLLRDDPDYRRTYSKVLSIWLFCLAFIGLGIALFSGELLMTFTPAPYWPAAPVMIFVALGAAAFGTTQITAVGISLERRSGLLTCGAILSGATNFGLNLWLIPWAGAIGAAVATLISYLVLTLFFLYWTQRLHPIPLEKGRLLYGCSLFPLALGGLILIPDGNIVAWLVAVKLLVLILVLAGAVPVGLVSAKFLNSFLKLKP
ncbi:oligosaccharide flippase family protein [Herbaspirillum sp. WKF16]|uniref:oligosaccharide flippase family protein n=1 Tax=Herbaspirillum sp. WKF16 TaxID=3028312 RepID=UPI0023A9C4D5|nr:oligosaccharide flippase family protein [Herbaspirillum sp. WKF16]WDZ96600.1 oligosaccharide flippase family protein [Herbaspirillum sp. WKF16]